MRWLRSLVVAPVLGAGLFFGTSDSAEARPRWGGYYGGYGGGYYNRGYYGYPRYYSNYGWPGYYNSYYGGGYYAPGWGYSTPGFYIYGR